MPLPNDLTLTPKIASHSNDEKIYTALEQYISFPGKTKH